ncbi:MAG: Mrp/NBP35 family ATP-binding protein, partial [Candidatus Methanomethylophilaceae archaeon]|nr:Mrp/NBP35 family ATP-binding protein [Candidatus Methanomethylophilaceae archaeon]
VMSGKGGVGKSTVSSNIAATLSMMGYQTGIMDVDITGPNIPKMFGIEDERLDVVDEKLIPVLVPPSLKVVSMAFLLPSKDDAVVWRGPVKMTAIRQFIEDVNWGDLDYLVVDMPPGTGDEAISIIQLIPKADGMVIVTTPQDVALLDSRKSITFSAQANIPIIGLIENMSGFVCPHCGKTTDIFKSGGGVATAKNMNIQFLGAVPIEPRIVVTGDSGMPIVIDDPDSVSAKVFKEITQKIVKTVE